MSLADWLIIAAILVGPVTAVAITLWIDKRRDRRQRRMDLFRTLMRTRRTPVDPEHVGALNLIEIEFSKDARVLEAWRRLFEHFGMAHARRDDEAILSEHDKNEQLRRTTRFFQRLAEERQRLLVRLLDAMASALKFPVEQLEIFEGGYTPQGWGDVELQQSQIRNFAAGVAMGQTAVPIAVIDYTSALPAVPPSTEDGGGSAPSAHRTETETSNPAQPSEKKD